MKHYFSQRLADYRRRKVIVEEEISAASGLVGRFRGIGRLGVI